MRKPQDIADTLYELAIIEEKLKLVRNLIREKELNDPTNSWEEYCEYMKVEWELQAKIDRDKRMLMFPEYRENDLIDEDDDVMSLEDFIEAVNEGCFIDYDGFGCYVKDGKKSNIHIYPSDVKHKALRKDFDTIVWFNK